ncbi:alpha/beta fold hydrolase [Lactobacillus sp. Sy-1]|uniref:alpha/beta fold hydrolase n=1 Tax=Lactobacillus sp. Sy-1 TaxID=2109645 RepID=UPI001C5B9BFA|nr:alpha/beta hydrolase [Lactobacillus sp. Sy-1]MBW1606089.1 alpha/beta hydrolase [Lactobacillus sp. Sy-1]
MNNEDYFDTDLGRYYLVKRPGNLLVVFLNGEDSFSTYDVFKPIIDVLDSSVGFLAIDKIGAGHSDNPQHDYSAVDEVNSINKMINNMNPEKVIFVAHSAGGIRSILLANQMDNVVGFVGIEPTTLQVISDPELQKEYFKHSPKDMEKFIKNQLNKNYPADLAAKVMKTATDKDEETTDQDMGRIQKSFENIDWQKLPVLPKKVESVVIAEEFRKNEYADSEYHTSKYTFVALGSNHYIQIEEPIKVSKVLNELVAKFKA